MIPALSTLPAAPAALGDRVKYRDGADERVGWVTGRCCPGGDWLVDVVDCEDRAVRVNLPAAVVVAVLERKTFTKEV